MRLPELFRTTAFRLTLLYMALFTLSVLVLLSFIYWNTLNYLDSQTDLGIQTETDNLLVLYRQSGITGLRNTLAVRATADQHTDQFYLLANADYTPLAGNLSVWPSDLRLNDGWANPKVPDFEGREHNEVEANTARALTLTLPGNYHLLLGRALDEREELTEHTLQALAIALLISLGLALLGGLVMSRSILRRIAGINRTSLSIMAGQLERRMPVTGSNDEFDQLAENLNAMLDQIQILMDAMRQVTDNVAHDLRSPLSRMQSRLEVCLLIPRDNEEYRAAIEQTLSDSGALLFTFNALLSIAQAEAAQDRNSFEFLNISVLLGEIAEFYQVLADEKGLLFTQSIDPALSLHGNRHLLIQAIGNLLDNAIKFTVVGGKTFGKILLSARNDGGTIELAVSDNGPGIPVSECERVLERFVRLETSRSTPGNGLGLSMVRAVARLHHAKLQLSDNAPGLRVSLRFPPG